MHSSWASRSINGEPLRQRGVPADVPSVARLKSAMLLLLRLRQRVQSFVSMALPIVFARNSFSKQSRHVSSFTLKSSQSLVGAALAVLLTRWVSVCMQLSVLMPTLGAEQRNSAQLALRSSKLVLLQSVVRAYVERSELRDFDEFLEDVDEDVENVENRFGLAPM